MEFQVALNSNAGFRSVIPLLATTKPFFFLLQNPHTPPHPTPELDEIPIFTVIAVLDCFVQEWLKLGKR